MGRPQNTFTDFSDTWFDTDRLHIGDPAKVSTLDRKYWSASSWKSWSKCPASWALNHLLPSSPLWSDPAPVGTAVHLALEILYGLPAEQRSLDRLDEIIETLHEHTDELQVPIPDEDLEDFRTLVWQRSCREFRCADPSSVEVLACERGLDTTVNGVPFKGFMDRTERTPDGLTKIIDTKSAAKGKKSDKKLRQYGDDHGDQLLLYSLAVEAVDGVLPGQVAIHYSATGQVHTRTLDRATLDRVAASFRRTWEESKQSVEDRSWPLHHSPLCQWCPAFTICPGAARLAAEKAKSRYPAKAESPDCGRAEACGVTVRETPPARGTDGGEPLSPEHQEHDMARTLTPDDVSFFDLEPWKTAPDGGINANGADFGAVLGYVDMAVKTLHGSQFPLKGHLRPLSRVYMSIVCGAQEELTGKARLGHPLNTRLRGILWAALETGTTPPLGSQEAAEWQHWIERMQRRLVNTVDASLELWIDGTGDDPAADMAAAFQ